MRAARFITAALAGALTLAGLAGCEGSPEWPPVRLGQSQVTLYLNLSLTHVDVSGGSGEYSVVISDPKVADASIEDVHIKEEGRGGDVVAVVKKLVINAKALGSAIVAVTDKRSGGTALLGLTVEKRHAMFRVTKVVASVDADNKAAVEEALTTADTRLKVGDGIDFVSSGSLSQDGNKATFTFSNAAGDITAEGMFTIRDVEEWPSVFLPITPAQYSYLKRWEFSNDGGEWWCGAMITKEGTRLNMPVSPSYLRFYEDLTEQCKAQFPDAGVRSVARMTVAISR